jgi:hypothetical protein
MCMTGTPAQAGNLSNIVASVFPNFTNPVSSDHEQVDADSFASMGADLLKCKLLLRDCK